MSSYVELIVRGDDRDVKAYLAGTTAKSPVRVVFADDAGFHIQELRERIKHHGEVQHVFVEQTHAPRIRAELAAAAPRYQFEVKEARAVSGVHFAFEFDTPSHEVATKNGNERLQRAGDVPWSIIAPQQLGEAIGRHTMAAR